MASPEHPESATDGIAGLALTQLGEGISIDILVVPRASRGGLGPVVGDRLKVAVTAPPVDGKANAAVIALLARAVGVRRAAVTIVSGQKGKRKTVRIAGATAADLRQAVKR